MKKYKGIVLISMLILGFIFLSSCSEDNPTEPSNQDSESPTILIQEPTAESSYVTLENVISISGSANDDQNLASIEWSSDDNTSGTATGLENWSIQNVTLSDGDNTITITAYDQASNFTSDVITITNNEFTNFYGKPFMNPSGIFKDESTEVLIRANLSVNPNLIENGVKLLLLDDNNFIIDELCLLYDDGNLSHGDEILGDNVFSTFYSFNESIVGNIKLRIAATTLDGTDEITDYSSIFILNVFEEITDEEFEEVINIQENAIQQLNDNFANHDIDEALNATVNWLSEQPEISSATLIEGNIEIEYISGLEGGLLISELDENGTAIFRGSSNDKKRLPNVIPINLQSKGKINEANLRSISDDIILDKDVLIYAPFEEVFAPHNEGPELVNLFSNSELEFNLTYLTNQECTISDLYNLTDYGFIVFATHGSMGEDIMTGELVTNANQQEYASLIRQNKIKIWTNITYDKFLWIFNKKADMYSIRSSFISSLNGTFPNSIIVNNSCESTMFSNLRNAFSNKGAKTYFGYDAIVSSSFAVDCVLDITQSLVEDLETTGVAFTAGQTDPQSPNAEFEMFGSQDMHFSLSLINGDFEIGDLTAWSVDGDGRVISQLGTQLPIEGNFMGIISTGLGFTTSTGTISQSFKVEENLTTLSLKWNFLSEEFLEYVGSQFQDYFKIIIRDSDGQETVIFEKTIDIIYSEYDLYLVSPQIVFDQGDVYMTDWQTFTYDLNQFENESITLILSAGDVGDSIYDTAILLDDITVE
jgi:hypothetical protein